MWCVLQLGIRQTAASATCTLGLRNAAARLQAVLQ
jgi:hypothetical protein